MPGGKELEADEGLGRCTSWSPVCEFCINIFLLSKKKKGILAIWEVKTQAIDLLK